MPIHDELPRPGGAPEPAAPSSMILWTLGATITRADIPRLCEELLGVLRGSDATVVICDVGAVADPDVVIVEAVARLQLTARQSGRHIRLHRASDRLRDLLVLTGLSDVLPLQVGLRLEP